LRSNQKNKKGNAACATKPPSHHIASKQPIFKSLDFIKVLTSQCRRRKILRDSDANTFRHNADRRRAFPFWAMMRRFMLGKLLAGG
jgi:hypothetical protein